MKTISYLLSLALAAAAVHAVGTGINPNGTPSTTTAPQAAAAAKGAAHHPERDIVYPRRGLKDLFIRGK